LESAHEQAPELPRDTEVVVYCACPNEVSAAQVARQLRRAGFVHVRPLMGGIDAWIAAGLPIERIDSV
jgi:rhodanese-related sulfurtransferase